MAQLNYVLLKDNQSKKKKNEWPLGIILPVFPSDDGKVLKVRVKITKKDSIKFLLRPVSEIILLLVSEIKFFNGV